MNPHLKIGNDAHFKWLEGVIAAIFILSILDGVMTLIWVLTGIAAESNPYMDFLIQLNPAVFMGVKIALAALGLVLLYRYRKNRLAVVGIFILFIIYYTIVVGLHLSTAGILIADL